MFLVGRFVCFCDVVECFGSFRCRGCECFVFFVFFRFLLYGDSVVFYDVFVFYLVLFFWFGCCVDWIVDGIVCVCYGG